MVKLYRTWTLTPIADLCGGVGVFASHESQRMRAYYARGSSLPGNWPAPRRFMGFVRELQAGLTPRARRVYLGIGLIIVGTILLQVINTSFDVALRVTLDQSEPWPRGDRYTIRVNTFRRNDMLKHFVQHFTTCRNVHSIQVVWSDQANKPPPISFFELGPDSRGVPVLFEQQPVDSLNNRFQALLPVKTEAVLSLDDDLVISCEDLDFAYSVWQSSPNSLVGFTPRLATFDPRKPGGYVYHSSYKMVWWNGVYNIVLTKCCFLHRKFLASYFQALSPSTLAWIEEKRNCEDIAMQFVASNETGGVPPVWVQARFQDFGTKSGISQGKHHEAQRGECVSRLTKEFGRMPLTLTSHKAVNAKKAWWF